MEPLESKSLKESQQKLIKLEAYSRELQEKLARELEELDKIMLFLECVVEQDS
jgi:hypothetical protein